MQRVFSHLLSWLVCDGDTHLHFVVARKSWLVFVYTRARGHVRAGSPSDNIDFVSCVQPLHTKHMSSWCRPSSHLPISDLMCDVLTVFTHITLSRTTSAPKRVGKGPFLPNEFCQNSLLPNKCLLAKPRQNLETQGCPKSFLRSPFLPLKGVATKPTSARTGAAEARQDQCFIERSTDVLVGAVRVGIVVRGVLVCTHWCLRVCGCSKVR